MLGDVKDMCVKKGPANMMACNKTGKWPHLKEKSIKTTDRVMENLQNSPEMKSIVSSYQIIQNQCAFVFLLVFRYTKYTPYPFLLVKKPDINSQKNT